MSLDSFIDFQDPKLHAAALVIPLCPLIWNILARAEFYTKILTKLALGNRYLGCYLLATWIFCFSLYRDYLFSQAVASQPKLSFLKEHENLFYYIGYGIIGLGGSLVIPSMYQLGVTGTYLGDYFGILMDNMVTSYPFNVMNNPMYDGASICFLGQAIA
jgi:methylene-fatty-acyl-phospholipid synthase